MAKRSSASAAHNDEIQVSLANEQSSHAVDKEQLVDAVKLVFLDSAFTSATVSLAVVDDLTMHQLNRQYLDHDWPTDVLSFVLQQDQRHLQGEIIISADTAATAAAEFGWPAFAEQLLYVIHGSLHLIGYGDKTPSEIQEMRAAEAKYLRKFGFEQSRAFGVGDVRPIKHAVDPAQRGATGT